MFYLLYPLADVFTPFNLFRYLTFRSIAAFLTALVLSFLIGGGLIRWLRSKQKQGQPIRDDGPASHLVNKKGTPTMGGLLILIPWVGSTLLWASLSNRYVWIALLVTVVYGLLGFLDDAQVWPALLVRWELVLLEELGFGLDLSSCAATGSAENLIYVSPRSGRAVSAEAGEPYKERLLTLPAFLRGRPSGAVTGEDLKAGYALTGHFLDSRVLRPREMELPEARGRLLSYLWRNAAV